MPKKDKALPRPPSRTSRFSEREEGEGKSPLMADQMAMAAAEGRLEQFMDEALPDSEHARKLAAMMMGMSGMMPSGRPAMPPSGMQEQAGQQPGPSSPPEEAAPVPPEAVYEAARNEDVKGLMDLLKAEHAKRSGETETAAAQGSSAQKETAEPAEKILVDRIMETAYRNGLSPDWIVMRALKLYFEEYDKTGRL